MDEIKGRIISMFKDIELFLNSEEYSVDLRHELNALNPDYLVHLEKRRKDMEKSDHGIVIAGETSAGKSTLINKLLGKRIFKGSIFESTSTICKLQNSDRIVITAKNDNEIIDERDLTEICDLKTPKGVKVLRDSLKELTDKTSLQESTCIRSVDVKLPIPFLKGNTFLVDTPGIGGSPEVSQKLKDYLPNAISFVFVINVASAGGMQRDRMKERISAASSVEDVNDELEKPPEAETTSRQRLEPLPSVSNNKKAFQEEKRLLSNIANRGEQSMAFQTKFLEMLAPPKTTERTAYANWTNEVMVNLHPSLWLKFQMECTNLLYTYQEKSEELLHPVANQQFFSTTAIISSATAVPSFSQDFLWYCINKPNVATSSSAVTYSRPTKYVCVGIEESCLGPGADDRPSADNNDDHSIPLIEQSHHKHPYPICRTII